MNDEVKANDLVKRISPVGTELTARVRWVNEKGEAGVTYITPEKWAGSAQVVDVDELAVIKNNVVEDLKDVPTSDLIKAISRLRSARLPKKPTVRKPSARKKKSTQDKLDALFAGGGPELDALIERAAKELREEGR